MSDARIAADAARLEGAIDAALARSVVYHAITLGLRPAVGGRTRGLASPGGRAALGGAAVLLDGADSSEEALRPAVERLCDRAGGVAERLAAHARLFGHSRGLVCPFETEYGAGDAFRQPPELADIAGTYLAFGLEPAPGSDERVDHVACECEFMDFLARKEAFTLSSGENEERGETGERLATVRKAARGFLRDHLGRFGRTFASLLMKEDPHGFHGALGAVLFRFLTGECRRFGLPPGPPSLELRAPGPDPTPMACGEANEELIQVRRRRP